MERLPTSLFNEMRSYFSFRELHAHRTINSKWNNVERAPKSFDLQQDPPGRACVTNVKLLNLAPEHKLSIAMLDRILYESRNSLEAVAIARFPEGLDFVPVLPNISDSIPGLIFPGFENKALRSSVSFSEDRIGCAKLVD